MAIERMTIALPSEMADVLKSAVAAGQYASTSEVVREALREWTAKRQQGELAALKRDIEHGLADLKAGRVRDFSADEAIARGRKLLATRSGSPKRR
ncbi:type II toxin-antitoxin system ParD family antitoxin [Steroidobacter sp.]|uniref:type II toxin-antitoxin system ParD family antitoxin n=1 Tax=Steroidobacter sp. TaxID=1978227 RepID=UPI001A520C80|nr:type II toxin-antitoxin system ParD family antitoxin [Steroidobacter sp.]MBL8269302.1 type II toxin-antitoxin system ParD family antitoxin [Steroidobacter sp.]